MVLSPSIQCYLAMLCLVRAAGISTKQEAVFQLNSRGLFEQWTLVDFEGRFTRIAGSIGEDTVLFVSEAPQSVDERIIVWY